MKSSIKKIKKHLNELKKFGSPLYIYDYDILMERSNQMKAFKEKLEKLIGVTVNIHYSPKANNNPAILEVVKKIGFYVDSMSPLELSISKKSGFKSDEILYVCNNVDEEEMKLIHDSNIKVCLDSVSQVEMWGKLFPHTDIIVRINPGIFGVGHHEKVITSGAETKFGVSEKNMAELLKITRKYKLNIIGIHQHLGSLFLDDQVDHYLDGIKAGLDIIKKYFKGIRIIDLGGGFGVPYKSEEKPLNLDLLAIKLGELLNNFLKEIPNVKEFKFEIGRFIPCEAGILMGKVNAIKSDRTYWIGTDIGMNELVRPSMYDAYHEVSLLEPRKAKKINANICGNICESGDIIGKNRVLNLPKVGDVILVHNAGAYGYSMSSNYTGRPRPAEIMLYDDKIKLIRMRDTIDTMEENIVW